MEDISLGWCPDVPDVRDLLLAENIETVLPSRADLRDEELGSFPGDQKASVPLSCAISALRMLDWQFKKWRGRRIDASAEFLHQLTLKICGGGVAGASLGQGDVGIRSILKTLKRFGAPPRLLCDQSNTSGLLDRPELFGYADCFQKIQYIRLDSPWDLSRHQLDVMRSWLVHGNPFLIGFAVPHNISKNSTLIPLDVHRGGTIGGTACVVMGYDDDFPLFGQVKVKQPNSIENLESGAFLVQTCCGQCWPQLMWLPYAFVESRFARDAWAIRIDGP